MPINKQKNARETAILGGGCFWCLETVFLHARGIEKVVSGYAGGNFENPTYEKVSAGKTGHAETIKLDYNPDIISYKEILGIFFSVHDPTTLNRQGNDVGTQYRSLILYGNGRQKEIAEKIISDLEISHVFEKPIVTEVKMLEKFYPAEDYHQRYFEKNPDKAYCQIIISPKLSKFREKYKNYYR